ncbi:MAG: phage holin family protein [Clostridiales bacterium]|nr:phage holin family protein [Clostridiales bacterium]
MEDIRIELIWTKVQIAITAIGGWVGYFVGGMDGMLIALIVMMSLDYLSGVMCAIMDRKLSSAVGFRGICKKVLILMLVGVANVVDMHVIGTGSALRGAVICFYLSNEALSLFENAAHIGLPIPDKLREALAQLHGRDDKDSKDKAEATDTGDGN